MHDKVHAQAMRTLGLRATDPQAFDQELSITLPVWFHPWKYEHEAALAVPLLMHLSDSLRHYLKDAQTLEEAVREALQLKTTAVATWGADAKKKLKQAQKLLTAVHLTASHTVTQAAAAIAGSVFGMSEKASEALKWVADTAKELAGTEGDDADAAEAIGKAMAEHGHGEAKAPSAEPKEPRFTADGSYYYNVQRHLRDLAVLTPDEAKKQGLPKLTHPVRLNFVVFIDDLDRCLPEQAVKVLEIIKTLLNVECFAFVAALDDEVIERGIAHRYREYRFQGAKPEMPITGAEYLEKIVHLPFRLPALTRAQAQQFIGRLEDHLMAAPGAEALARLWFERDVGLRGTRGDEPALARLDTGTDARVGIEPEEAPGPGLKPTPLVDMLLDCFDVAVPRKLARAVESLHHMQRVLHQRGITLSLRRS